MQPAHRPTAIVVVVVNAVAAAAVPKSSELDGGADGGAEGQAGWRCRSWTAATACTSLGTTAAVLAIASATAAKSVGSYRTDVSAN